MAFLRALGAYLPARVVTSTEAAAWVGADPTWILQVSGIEERRFAAADEPVAALGAAAARDCLERANLPASEVGLLLVSSGSAEAQFPGPAAEVAHSLGLAGTPAIDLPIASAGSLFGLALAHQLAPAYGPILVVAAEKMSRLVAYPPQERGVAVLFGDGAGAALVDPRRGFLEFAATSLGSDGAYAADLRAAHSAPVEMNGRSVILQASRKIPAALRAVLDAAHTSPADVHTFLMHQANQNLIDKVAATLGVGSGKFFSNIRRYGNTSSASMLIAAHEWWTAGPELPPGAPVAFAAFGAGFHWGALLAFARPVNSE
jgi:3-oxoacyl-[acyl-carrier-protein] synthase-3